MEKKRRKEIRREILVQFKVTEEEYEEIKIRSRLLSLSKSKFVRNALFTGKTCVGCSDNYLIPNRDEDGYRIGEFSPPDCYMCSRNYLDRYKK